MSRELAQTLKDLHLERQIEARAGKWETVPEWVFCSETGGLFYPHNLRDRIFYNLLAKAGMRKVRFHDLRHTLASLLLQNGESPVYVKEQMGHSSIQVTVDLCGHLTSRVQTGGGPNQFTASTARSRPMVWSIR